MFNTEKSTSDILINLEKKCYVSSKNKSFFDYLAKGPECPIERNYPLLSRIGLENLNTNNS